MKLLKLFLILKTSSFFFLGEKMADPMKLIAEKEPDLDLLYDFDSMSSERKKVFIEHIFLGERIFLNTLFSGMIEFFLDMFEKVQREKQDDIINGLKRKMNFHEFKTYFASFFYFRKWTTLC